MYSTVDLNELDRRNVDEIEPDLKPIGLALQCDKMRPNLWQFEAGDATNRHRQKEQEELYVVLNGRLTMDVGDKTFTVDEGDYVVVDPNAWRQLTADEPSEVLIIGAPNTKDDGIIDKKA